MGEDVDRIRRDASLIDAVAAFGYKLDRNGYEFETCCPFHREETASFTIFPGQDGVDRFFCFGCGKKGDVLDFVQAVKGVNLPEAIRIIDGRDNSAPNVTPRQLRNARDHYEGIIICAPPAEPIEPGKRVKLYNPKRKGDRSEWGGFAPSMVFPYRNADGSLFGYVLRHELPDGSKETPMVMFVTLPDGLQTWSRFPFPKPRPLYGLENLGNANRVFIVEGEKCRDRLQAVADRPVVSWAGGTQGVKHTDWTPLKGRRAVIWPDHDAAGAATGDEIAWLLFDMGAADGDISFVGHRYGEAA